ncbi:MAG: pyrroloquinoline quinone biosynthesis protein PqqB [Pseudomonadota bacterium]
MRIIVLGTAAGGGLPQWNCGCKNCMDAREGRIATATQSSIAVSGDGQSWIVFNASPDIRQQLTATPALYPRALRDTPIAAVLLTNGDVDHVAGLLTLREKSAFDLYATAEIHAALDANPIFGVADPALVKRRTIALGDRLELPGSLTTDIFAVPGKVPLYQEEGEVETEAMGETTIGVRLTDGEKVAYYIPGCAAVPDDLIARLQDGDLLLFDGTVWENDEMPRLGAGPKTGKRMGHVPMKGAGGSMERLSALPGRRVFIHVNNTNPVLQPDGPERAAVYAAGWELAADGLEFML